MTDNIVGSGWAFPPYIDTQGTVAMATGDEEIKQAIRIILGTARGERVMRPTFGSRLHELVFDPMHAATFALARKYVREALEMWEPRIELINIEVYRDTNGSDGCLHIAIEYEIKATHDERSLVYPFYLIPGE